MKKLKLKMYLSGAELLNREQMKQIVGGFIWDDGSGSGSGSGSGGSFPPPIDHGDPPDCLGSSCDENTSCPSPCSCEKFEAPGEVSYGCLA